MRRAIAALAAASQFAALSAPAASLEPGRLVRCESAGLGAVACPAASHADVRVARVLGGRCIPGITWFYDRRAIHVRAGCRAVFVVGGPPPAGPR